MISLLCEDNSGIVTMQAVLGGMMCLECMGSGWQFGWGSRTDG